ncbi:SET domain-containing protein SmydA-8-like isoform X2 [Bicyclus anynana]|uniref:SET domain-containing protein SmydA-8-like isoform X2 n=1 Tax=Bicyclus anynana TaxID=110368 RepID=A0A6J1NTI5_BICAN|nr:SET domain-containing protein SmydA-8-like isoform X2 [Bicyclus anynana]XP_023948169.2 SET domain-containing protein SmydA-8-like isoform X2 [Bicyclus anynana]
MNKKSHTKKKKRRARNDVRNKENIIEDCEAGQEPPEDEVKTSKELCYEIKHSDVMGRYIVATRAIKPGEVIIEAPALAVGPCAGCALICLACYRELEENNLSKCSGCQWPLCSSSCFGLKRHTGHSTYECEALKANPPDYSRLEDLKDSYQALMPLRCLLLKKADPEKWAALSAMEAHNSMRRARGDIFPNNERHVVQRLRGWGLQYEDDEIHTVCGILEVNAFEVGGSGANARALYDAAFLLAHDCTPSTTHTDAERAPARPLAVRAAVPHAPGDLITLCYAYTLQGTLRRREHLKLSKFFECTCKRCSDPTELGTHASAFCCPKCAGRVLSSAPLVAAAPWRCERCPYEMPVSAVQVLLKRLTEEFEQIDANDVQGYESFLTKYRNVLADSHYLCLSAKHSLSQLYGKVTDYMIHEMPEEQLQRKVEICRDLMKVFDVIEPGYSRLRGITLYELHAPLMVLTTRDFEKKAITKDSLRNRLKEIVGYLSQSALILSFEPRHTPEGLMAGAASDALRKIKTWEQIIGKIS